MKQTQQWTNETYKAGMEEEIVSLMQEDIEIRDSKAVFNLELWNWKYRNNCAGFFENWIALARSSEDQKLVGHYTVIPVGLYLNGKNELGVQSVDTMVHSDFRKQGIFTRLAEKCYEAVAGDRIGLVYGYPNEQSYPGFVNKLGWRDIFTVEEMAYVLNPQKVSDARFSNVIMRKIAKNVLSMREGILDIKRGSIKKDNYTSIEHEKFDFKLDVINQWLKERYRYFIDRNLGYLEWRYLQNPIDKDIVIKSFKKDNDLKGIYVIKLKRYPHRENLLIGHIMELLSESSDAETLRYMLDDIVSLCKKRSVDILHLYTSKSQHDYDTITGFGFKKFDAKQYIIKAFNKIDDYPEITNPSSWFISLGDSDRA